MICMIGFGLATTGPICIHNRDAPDPTVMILIGHEGLDDGTRYPNVDVRDGLSDGISV